MSNALALIRELTEENEKLATICDMKQCVIENAEANIAQAKDDTVRRMQEEARQMCFVVGDEEYVTLCDLDKIAKELLEEGSDDA